MRLEFATTRIPARPGTRSSVQLSITNDDDRTRTYRVRTLGLDDAWDRRTIVTPPVEPGGSTELELTVELPRGFPAGGHVTGVEVTPLVDAGEAGAPAPPQVVELVLEVGATDSVTAAVEPGTVRARGRFRVVFRNRTRDRVQLDLAADDPNDRLRVRFREPQVTLGPREDRAVSGRIRARQRPWFGTPVQRPFTVVAQGHTTPLHVAGAIVVKPRISRGLLKVVALLTLVTFWAAMVVTGIDRLRDRGSETRAVGISNAENGGGGDGSGSGSGGEGEGGEDGGGSGAGEEGAVAEGAVISGEVKAKDPEAIDVTLERVSLGDDLGDDIEFVSSIKDSGQPTKIVGSRLAPTRGQVVPDVTRTRTDESGRYAFTDVDTPGLYRVRFAKAGFTTRSFIVDVDEGGATHKIDVDMEAGDGELGGAVVDADGPIGDVEVAVTDGDITFVSKTASVGDAVGRWAIEGVSTPGKYLVTAARHGYGTESRVVTLDAGGGLDDVDFELTPGVGSLSGLVTSADGPLGNVKVSITDGTFHRTTDTLTVGQVGAYLLPKIPVPGTYTLTFETPGWVLQSKTIELEGNRREGTTLVRETATLHGEVTEVGTGNPVSTAGLTLTRPTGLDTGSAGEGGEGADAEVYKGTTTSDGFRMTGVPPGTYVLTVEHFSYEQATSLITFGPGEVREQNVELTPRDPNAIPSNGRLNGLVISTVDGTPVGNAEVKVDGQSIAPNPVKTGANGTFEVASVAPGSRRVDIVHPDFSTAVRAITVGIGENAGLGTVRLVPRARLKVRVTDAGLKALEGMAVCVYPRPVGTGFDGTPPPDNQCVDHPLPTTDVDGRVDVIVDNGVTYDVYVRDDNALAPTNIPRYLAGSSDGHVVPEGSLAVSVPVPLDSRPLLTVASVDPANPPPASIPVADATIEITRQDGSTLPLAPAVTDGNGLLRTPGTDHGIVLPEVTETYTVRGSKTGYRPTTATVDFSSTNSTRRLDLPLTAAGGETAGRLTYSFERIGAPTETRPVKQAEVTIDGIRYYEDDDGTTRAVRGELVADDPDDAGLLGPGVTDDSGDFTFSGLYNDDATTPQGAPLKGTATLSVEASGFQDFVETISVPVTGLVRSLVPTSTNSFTGTVNQRIGPDDDTDVAPDGSDVTASIVTPTGAPAVAVAGDGTYSATDLAPREYEVTFSKPGYESVTERFEVLPPPDDPTAAPTVTLNKLGSIAVTVDNLAPGTRAEVTLRRQVTPDLVAGSPCSPAEGETVEVLTTPAAGSGGTATVVFENLVGGIAATDVQYCVAAERPTARLTTATTLNQSLVVGQNATLDLPFVELGSISGTLDALLTTGFTEPVANVEIALFDSADPATVLDTTRTAADGTFTFADLEPGITYQLSADPVGYDAGLDFTTAAPLGDGEALDLDGEGAFTLRATKGVVSGTARSNGTALGGVTVTAYNVVNGETVTVTGAGDGTYSFTCPDPCAAADDERLDPVRWELRFSKDGYREVAVPITVQKGGTHTVDADLPRAFAVITGRALGKIGNGSPTDANLDDGVSTVEVTLYPAGSNTKVPEEGNFANPVQGVYDATAGRMRFAFDDVPAEPTGTYFDLEITKPGWEPVQIEDVVAYSGIPTSVPVSVLEASPRDVSVLVTDEDGRDVDGVTVSLQGRTGGTNPGPSSGSDDTTGGVATIGLVTPGDYEVQVAGNAAGWTDAVDATVSVPPATVTPTDVFAYDTDTATSGRQGIVIEPLLKVVVRGEGGTLLAGASVATFPATTAWPQGTTTTDSNGEMLFLAPAASYSLQIDATDHISLTTGSFAVDPGADGDTQTVSGPHRLYAQTDLEIVVQDGDDGDEPVEGASVEVERDDGTGFIAVSGSPKTTGPDGAVVFPNLDPNPANSYRVSVTGTGYADVTSLPLGTLDESSSIVDDRPVVVARTTVTLDVALTQHQDGTPSTVSGATVDATDLTGATASCTEVAGPPLLYRCTGVKWGDVTVEATKAGYADAEDVVSVPAGVTTFDAEVHILDQFELRIDVEVGGVDVTDATVALEGQNGEGNIARTTAPAGVALFEALTPGTYAVTITKPGEAWSSKDCGLKTYADDGNNKFVFYDVNLADCD